MLSQVCRPSVAFMMSTGVRTEAGVSCALQEVDDRFALGQHLLAQAIAGVVPVEPDGIVVHARHAAPDRARRGFAEGERGLHVAFLQLRDPSGREGPLPLARHVLLQVGSAQRLAMPDARRFQQGQIDALPVIVEVDRLDEPALLPLLAQPQPHLLLSLGPGHDQHAALPLEQSEEEDSRRGRRACCPRDTGRGRG